MASGGRSQGCDQPTPKVAISYAYFTFDDAVALAAAESDPVAFVADLPDRAILDEGQRVPAVCTVTHDGIPIQDRIDFERGTESIDSHAVTDYTPHPEKGLLMLQDHRNPIPFRNA
jgi:hypothetical protein